MKTHELFEAYNPVTPDAALSARGRAELRQLVPGAVEREMSEHKRSFATPVLSASEGLRMTTARRLVPVAAAAALVAAGGFAYSAVSGHGVQLAVADELTGEVVAVQPDAYGTSITFTLSLDDVTGEESYLVFKLWTKTAATGGVWAQVGDPVTLRHDASGAYAFERTETLPFDLSLVLAASEEELADAMNATLPDDDATRTCLERAGLALADGAPSTYLWSLGPEDEVPVVYTNVGDTAILAGVACPEQTDRPGEFGESVGSWLGVVVDLAPVGRIAGAGLGTDEGELYALGGTGTDEAGLQAALAGYTLTADGQWSGVVAADAPAPPAAEYVTSVATGDPEAAAPADDEISLVLDHAPLGTLAEATALLDEHGLLAGYTLTEMPVPAATIEFFPEVGVDAVTPGTVVTAECRVDTKVCELLVAA
jgi:hypothetical protein